MNIKAILAAASALIFSATAVSAQTPHAAAGTPTCTVKKCDEGAKGGACPFSELNLTDAQKAELNALKVKQANARKEAKQQERVNRSNARKEYLSGIKAILTPEQYVQFLENSYLKAGKGNFGKGGKPGKVMKRGDRKPGKDIKGGKDHKCGKDIKGGKDSKGNKDHKDSKK